MQKQTEKPKKKFYKRWWFWVIVAIFILGIIGSAGQNNSQPGSQQGSTAAPTTTGKTAPKTTPAVNTTPGQNNNPASTQAPITLTPFTDAEYLNYVHKYVYPSIVSAGNDGQQGDTMAADNDITDALADYKKGQSDIADAKAGLQDMQGLVPSDMKDIDSLLNKAVNSYAKGFDLLVADINSNNSNTQPAEDYMTQGNLYLQQATTDITQWNAKK